MTLGQWRPRVVGIAAAVALGTAWSEPALRRSGWDYASPAVQALQRDDTQNPAMLWVAEGAARWRDGADGRSCASCHGQAQQAMRGVALRYPAVDTSSGTVLNLAGRIERCRRVHQRVRANADDDAVVLALETFVSHQSRGLPIAPPKGEVLEALDAQGLQLWRQPFGQLAMSCAMCHDGLAGKRLAGSTIPEAHPTGYPLYRLEWQAVGTLQRRIRNCLIGVRAEPFAPGAAEWLALEVMLMRRAAGMTWETPAVRP